MVVGWLGWLGGQRRVAAVGAGLSELSVQTATVIEPPHTLVACASVLLPERLQLLLLKCQLVLQFLDLVQRVTFVHLIQSLIRAQ